MAESTPGSRRRQLAHGVESRKRIMDAAFEVAAENGYEGATLALITKRAGLPASSVYWQFTSKDELLAEVVRSSYEQWRESYHSWEDVASGPLDESVRSALEPLAKALVDEPRFWRLGLMLALERRVQEVSARAEFRAVRKAALSGLEQWWARALAGAGRPVGTDGPLALARLTLSAADGLFIASQVDDEVDTDRLVALVSIGLVAVAEHLADEHAAAPVRPTRRRPK